jgi:hypothetical protein
VIASQLTSAVDTLTADGRVVRLRPVTPDDASGLSALYRRGSPDSLRLRFFGVAGEHVLAEEIERLVRPRGGDHDVVVAELDDALIGVASY